MLRRGLHVSMVMTPDWDNIDRIREAIRACVVAVYGDTELQDALGMVCAELLENAIKYGAPGAPGVRIAIFDSTREIAVTVSNVIGDEGHARRLAERVAWLRGFERPEDAYLSAVAGTYGDGDDAAGLGIARIAYEGGCTLAVERKDEMMTVRATCAIAPDAATGAKR